MRVPHRRGGLLHQLLRGRYVYVLLAVGFICIYGLLFEISLLSSGKNAEIHQNPINDVVHQVPMATHSSLKKPKRLSSVDYTIAVLLTNYRDSERCVSTLTSLFDNAQAPQAIHLFLFEEIDPNGDAKNPNDASCLDGFCSKEPELCNVYRSQIDRKFRNAADHKGPSPARRIVEEMIPSNYFVDNKYYLSIDSRMDFVENWDTLMLAEWKSIKNPNAILSTAPPATRSRKYPQDTTKSALMCTSRITSKKRELAVIEFNSPVLVKPPFSTPLLSSQYSESFHFGPTHALEAAPSDPNLVYTWEGITYYRATRWWTRGYDFYSPGKPFIYQHYVPRILHPLQTPQWNVPSPDPLAVEKMRQVESYARMQQLYPGDTASAPYNVGTKRSYEQWIAFSNMYPTASYDESTDKQFINCNPLTYVQPKSR
ncbi:hypothetical protein THRCLA_02000 [Thraustotheca clavata]|uniref:Uncharacterized protein n=1 Tax=Thraustotheca clavata TaxID=74557 RepID=A0A1W0A6T6_9STRA|nr:hypothetical protein THRCLA_02000 [Thraustotheca clavata]